MSKQEVFGAQSAYETALAAYEAHRTQNKDVIEDHDHLAVQLSEALETLKNALRENQPHFGKAFGGFSISVPRVYNVEKLKQLMGDDAVPYIKTTESVDSKAFEEGVKAEKIPQDVVDKVVEQGTPRISGGPKPPTIYQR